MATAQEAADQLRRLRIALGSRPEVAVPRVDESSPKTSDDAARKEAQAIASGELETASAKREHGRTERFRDDVALAVRIVFWLGFFAIIFSGILWAVNFIIPSKHYLTTDQSETILSFLTGSGLTGFIGNYARKRLRPNRRDGDSWGFPNRV